MPVERRVVPTLSSPSRVSPGWLALGGCAALAFFAALYAIFVTAPVEARMGIVQKIFYFHVPSAFAMYLGFVVCGVASLTYLMKRKPSADAWALAGAEVGTLFAMAVLISGPLWARKAWGVWWTWDPRLTSTFLTAMIFMAYLGLRSFGDAGAAEKRFASGLGAVGLLMLPIVHYATKKWGGTHPRVVSDGGGGLHADMYPAFYLSCIAFLAMAAWFVWTRARIEFDRHRLAEAELLAAQLAGEDEWSEEEVS